jgi:hypothetical protein
VFLPNRSANVPRDSRNFAAERLVTVPKGGIDPPQTDSQPSEGFITPGWAKTLQRHAAKCTLLSMCACHGGGGAEIGILGFGAV